MNRRQMRAKYNERLQKTIFKKEIKRRKEIPLKWAQEKILTHRNGKKRGKRRTENSREE